MSFRCKYFLRFIISASSVIAISSDSFAQVKATADEEATCKEIGFTPKTEAFGSCVLELVSRRSGETPIRATPKSTAPPSSPSVQTSPNGQTCARYGFKPKTTAFAQCQLDLDAAQRQAEAQQRQYELQVQQHQQQVAAYEAQVAAAQRERERRGWEALTRFGLGMAGSRSPSFLGAVNDGLATTMGLPTAPPVAPPPPMPIQTYTIRTPAGQTMICSYNTIAAMMSCN